MAEGNYVEPDLKFGHGYLDCLKIFYFDEIKYMKILELHYSTAAAGARDF